MADYQRLVEIQQHLSLAKPDHYLSWYYQFLHRSVDAPIKLLELGIAEGSSLMMWREFFSKAEITGLDLDPVELDDDTGRIATYAGEQQDKALLDRIGRERAPEGFDVIIDDASHRDAGIATVDQGSDQTGSSRGRFQGGSSRFRSRMRSATPSPTMRLPRGVKWPWDCSQ